MMPLLLGTALALGALAFVLVPLFRDAPVVVDTKPVADPQESTPSQRAIDALREVEFDRETGKLSETDYTAMKAAYTREALAAMRAEETANAPVSDDELEAMIRAHRTSRACAHCGAAAEEPDAVYCSSCGRYLPGQCSRCGAAISEPGARFCASCGQTLAA